MKKPDLLIYDRQKKTLFKEKIYGSRILHLLYDHRTLCRRTLASFFAKTPLCSYLYGLMQNTRASRYKIGPFIKNYGINTQEFDNQGFTSFNAFFIRKLKPSARPISKAPLVAPADGRYLVVRNLHKSEGFFIKGQKFSLLELLKYDEKAYKRYKNGSLVIARLAPPDYHRFHFPMQATPCEPILENRFLFSVNPIALKNNINIIAQNKRYKILLKTKNLGESMMFCVGATNVGSMNFTYEVHKEIAPGDEVGYFSFGGSMILLLFEKDKVRFAKELLEQSGKGIETYCRMGESLVESD